MMRLRGPLAAVMFASAVAVTSANAQQRGSSGGRLELVAQSQHVTAGLGDWSGIASRMVLRPSDRDTWFAEALYQRAFKDDGVFVGVGERRRVGDRWSTFFSLGGGTGEFVLPDMRADAQLARTWGGSRRLITTLGTTFVDAKRGYSDISGFGSLTVYASALAVIELGERVTTSSPGSVRSARAFGAMTVGREGKAYLVVRGSTGTEGYQLLGVNAAHRHFQSQEGSLSWRQWFGRRGGLLVQGDSYSNDLYSRSGVSVGVFTEW
ncbi:MAG: YaiO family outer membrane beta-barrel protein [Gemmatimonadaceae bacterium]